MNYKSRWMRLKFWLEVIGGGHITMEGLERRNQLYSNPSARLEVFEAWSQEFRKEVLVKMYSRSEVDEADVLAKEMIRQVQAGPAGNAMLRDVIFAKEDYKSNNYKVALVYEKLAGVVDRSVIEADDSACSHPVGLSRYHNQIRRTANQWTLMELSEALAEDLKQRVIIKTYRCPMITEANVWMREALMQAAVSAGCENNCKLYDVAITGIQGQREVTISLVMEMLDADVGQDIEQRRLESQPYTETELLTFLKHVCAGLAHAKRLVTPIQKVAHRDVKPANVFKWGRLGFKVGDFGAAWMKTRSTQARTAAGTIDYFSPELRIAYMSRGKQYDPFKSDVYSLGVSVLHMAKLIFPEPIATFEESVLASALREELRSLHLSDPFKRLLSSMMAFDPERRLSIETVSVEVAALLSAGAEPRREESKLPAPPVTSKLTPTASTASSSGPASSVQSSQRVGSAAFQRSVPRPEPAKTKAKGKQEPMLEEESAASHAENYFEHEITKKSSRR